MVKCAPRTGAQRGVEETPEQAICAHATGRFSCLLVAQTNCGIRVYRATAGTVGRALGATACPVTNGNGSGASVFRRGVGGPAELETVRDRRAWHVNIREASTTIHYDTEPDERFLSDGFSATDIEDRYPYGSFGARANRVEMSGFISYLHG